MHMLGSSAYQVIANIKYVKVYPENMDWNNHYFLQDSWKIFTDKIVDGSRPWFWSEARYAFSLM